MNLAAESPVSSSSSEDFVAFLDAELEHASSSSSHGTDEDNGEGSCLPEQEEDGDIEAVEGERIKRRKLEDAEEPSEPLLGETQINDNNSTTQQQSGICSHPGFFKGLCISCAKHIEDDDSSNVPLGYIHKDLKLRSTEIDRLREIDQKNLLREKKLVLVLDLDHTLLNSARLIDIIPQEEYLFGELNVMSGDPNRSLFKLENMHLITKLRPYVHTFLSEVSRLYELYIYTMAERSYALEIAKILDPGGLYFNSKVISQSDCTQRYQKGLDVVVGAESSVIILDDTETVWQRHRENLIVMERYHYFAASCRQFSFSGESLSVSKKDESETEGILSNVLNVLKRVHGMFFNPDLGIDMPKRDVRLVLQKVRQEILQGCRVVFSRIFPSSARAEEQHIWKKCQQLGATCCDEVDTFVTHVISLDRGTQKARWALQNERFLVSPGWVEAAFYLWKRLPEEDYPVTDLKSKQA